MVVFQGYFDESGSFEESDRKVFCIAGYYLTPENAIEMEREWMAALSKYGVTYFHMVECVNRKERGDFFNKPAKECDDLARELFALIKRYTNEGLAVIAHGDYFDKEVNPYVRCAELAVVLIQSLMESHQIDGVASVYFEKGHDSQRSAMSKIAAALPENVSVTFAGKKAVPLLQAADMLAWLVAKKTKDPGRDRGDMRALLEHKHTFALAVAVV